MPEEEEILTIPTEGMTPDQYQQLEKILEDWEAEVRSNATALPRRGYELGVEQAVTFLRMLGRVGHADPLPTNRFGPTKAAAIEWQKRHTLHELDGALAKYKDEIKSAALNGLRGAVNSADVASWLYKATKDASVNWRRIARTEMVRANAAGRLDASEAMGYEKVWAPRHTGACASCRGLLEGRVFSIDEVRDRTNYGRKQKDWIACVPLHPHCRHIWVPWIPEVFDQAEREYKALADAGFDDRTLDEMFDSSGQVRSEYANDPRLKDATGKTRDPLMWALASAVEKTTTRGRRHPGPEVGKGFFDNPQVGLDPLLWTPEESLRPDVRDRIVRWWRGVFSADAPLWSHLYITGSSTSRAWGGRKTAGDVDVQVIVDCAALRKRHPEYASLSDVELHTALRTHLLAGAAGVEAANGLPLEAFIRPEQSTAAFERDVADKGQGVWDLGRGRWVVAPPVEPITEDVDHGLILEGEGARVARQHPEWLEQARKLAAAMEVALDDESSRSTEELQQAYSYVHDLRAREFGAGRGTRGLGNFLWRYLMDFGPLAQVKHRLQPTSLEKVFPLYELSGAEVAKALGAAGRGHEHWITVHTHHDDETGIPVLVRDDGDGTATVIAGADGHLNHLQISPF